MSIIVANVQIPITVERAPDGWFVARGRLSAHHIEQEAASRDFDKAVTLLRCKLTTWSN